MRHGTSTAYITHKCRCEACSVWRARYQKRYLLDRHRGVARLVDAEPLRAHVARLRQSGMSEWDITIAAGWKSRNALSQALRRPKVTPRTMQRVLAVTAPPTARGDAYVDATGTRRRLQALAVMGWPSRTIAARLGNHDHKTYLHIARGLTTSIRRRTADAIADLYDELWDIPGPAARTRTRALANGWVPPMAWNDDEIDNPAATAHATSTTAASRADAFVEDVTELREQGLTRAAIAQRLGITEFALEKRLRVAGRRDLWTEAA